MCALTSASGAARAVAQTRVRRHGQQDCTGVGGQQRSGAGGSAPSSAWAGHRVHVERWRAASAATARLAVLSTLAARQHAPVDASSSSAPAQPSPTLAARQHAPVDASSSSAPTQPPPTLTARQHAPVDAGEDDDQEGGEVEQEVEEGDLCAWCARGRGCRAGRLVSGAGGRRPGSGGPWRRLEVADRRGGSCSCHFVPASTRRQYGSAVRHSVVP